MRLAGSGWVVLGAPAFLYVGAVALEGLPAVDAAVGLAGFTATAAVVVVSYLWDDRRGTILACLLFAALVLLLALAGIEPGSLAAAGADVGWGSLAAGPLVLFLLASRHEGGLGTRVVGLGLATTGGLGVLAASAFVTTGPPSSISAADLLTEFTFVIANQLDGLAALIAGAQGSSPPLAAVHDSVYIALVGVAALGTLFEMVRPATGRGVSLPPAEDPEPVTADAPVELPPAIAAVLARASAPEPPPVGRLPGFPSLLVALALAGVALVATFEAPTAALFGVSAGALVGLLCAAIFVRASRTPTAPATDGGAADLRADARS